MSARALSVSSCKSSDDSQGLLSKILGLGPVEKATAAHSKVLTERETLYEFECKFKLHLILKYTCKHFFVYKKGCYLL